MSDNNNLRRVLSFLYSKSIVSPDKIFIPLLSSAERISMGGVSFPGFIKVAGSVIR